MRTESAVSGLLLIVILSGCGQSPLTDAEKWWLTPPATATHVAFENDIGKWGYKDRTGAVVIQPQFDYAVSFPGEGHLLVQDQGQATHVKTAGKSIGRVRIADKWGYIDAQGNILVHPRFDRALDFFEDLTAVEIGGKWGYIDLQGKMVLPPRYDEASPFLAGVAHVREGSRWYTIDRQGRNTADR